MNQIVINSAKQVKTNKMERERIEEQAFKVAPKDSPENPAYPNYTDTDIFVEGFKYGGEWAIQELEPKWISSNDRLPEIGKPVIVITDYLRLGEPMSDTIIGYLHEDGELIEAYSDDSYGWDFQECVRVWMEIPKQQLFETE